MSVVDRHRVNKVLVKVIDKFYSSIFERAANSDVIEDREMLDVFAKTYTSRVRANGHAEFCSHQQDRDNLVNAGKSATVDLAKIDRTGLKQLLEHHTIVTMFAGCDPNRRHRLPNGRMTENVVRVGRLFDPKRSKFRKCVRPFDRSRHVPDLVSVHHQGSLPSD